MKKGFTLIELLAVIVILAIIALIATPIILGIINDAREQSNKRTAELIAKGVELAYTSSLFKPNVNVNDFCTYMQGNFAMDNATVTSCKDKTATITSGSNSYSAVYSNGLVEISLDNVKLAEIALTEENSSSEKYAYKWYTGEYWEGPSIGSDVSTLATPLETTLPPDQTYYLKFKLDDTNKVTNAYVCAKFNKVDYCLEGEKPEYYGDENKGNVKILKNIQLKGINCSFYSSESYCGDGSINLNADLCGVVNATFDNFGCYVDDMGNSGCQIGAQACSF